MSERKSWSHDHNKFPREEDYLFARILLNTTETLQTKFYWKNLKNLSLKKQNTKISYYQKKTQKNFPIPQRKKLGSEIPFYRKVSINPKTLKECLVFSESLSTFAARTPSRLASGFLLSHCARFSLQSQLWGFDTYVTRLDSSCHEYLFRNLKFYRGEKETES